jgi:SPP1 gp7 family putative phage head morphogenesis protein
VDQDKLRDILFRHSVAARDIGQEHADAMVRTLNGYDEALTDLIATRYARIEADGFDRGPATTKRLEDMREAYREINRNAYQKAANNLIGDLEEVAGTEAEFAARAMKTAGAKLDLRTTIPGPQFLQSLIKSTPLPFADDGVTLLMPWLEVQEAGRLRRLEGALRMSAGLGETTGQAIARIRGTRQNNYTDGILQTSRRDATTIALTANSAIQNSAREEVFKRSKTIKFLEWSSILDSRTSAICQGRSGTIYGIDAPHPSPPAHPRCRSLLIPRRDNEGKKHKPFGEWLKDQPESVQDEVLGKARADIFRANPEFDFQSFFKERGGYKSLQELRQFDERLFAGGVRSPAPTPAPAPVRFTSPINREINDTTVEVISRKDVTKRLNTRLTENAKASAYDPRPEFRGVKAEHFGKAQLSTEFSDQAASAILALMPEVDAITDAFKLPRLRAIRSISGNSAVANMGDGTLGVHPTHFNGFASRVGVDETGPQSGGLSKISAEHTAMRAELADMLTRIGEIRSEIADLSQDPALRERYLNRLVDERELFMSYRKLADKEFKLRRKIATAQRQASDEVSAWKVGEEITKRPYTVDKYFTGIDRMRTVLFHETGHHIHQMWKKEGRRATVGTPPLERRLKQMFFNKFHGAAPGNLQGRGIERRNQLSSTYATTNEAEWFAESFAAFMMGRRDLADTDLVNLIEELLDEAAK